MAATPEPPKVEDVSKKNDEEFEKMRKEISELKEERGRLKGNLSKSLTVNDRLEKKLKEKTSPPSPEASQPKPEPVPVETKGSRKNRSWPLPYCPGPEWCGDPEHHSKGAKNSDFHDEVECVDCHAPLGPEADVKHEMESCPFCSSDRGYVARPGYTLKHDRCQGDKCSVKA